MAGRLHRTQILLEPDQHRALANIARREGRSISDVVREMVRQQLQERTELQAAELRRQLEALERIREHRRQVLAQRNGRALDVDVLSLIHEMRGKRDERGFTGSADRR